MGLLADIFHKQVIAQGLPWDVTILDQPEEDEAARDRAEKSREEEGKEE